MRSLGFRSDPAGSVQPRSGSARRGRSHGIGNSSQLLNRDAPSFNPGDLNTVPCAAACPARSVSDLTVGTLRAGVQSPFRAQPIHRKSPRQPPSLGPGAQRELPLPNSPHRRTAASLSRLRQGLSRPVPLMGQWSTRAVSHSLLAGRAEVHREDCSRAFTSEVSGVPDKWVRPHAARDPACLALAAKASTNLRTRVAAGVRTTPATLGRDNDVPEETYGT